MVCGCSVDDEVFDLQFRFAEQGGDGADAARQGGSGIAANGDDAEVHGAKWLLI